MKATVPILKTESQEIRLKFWKKLKYRFASWLVSKGLKLFIGETVLPLKYNLDIQHDQNLLLSHIFVNNVLFEQYENNSKLFLEFLNNPKKIAISVDNPLFSLYLYVIKCLSSVYDEHTPITTFNDYLFIRGMASFYEEMSNGKIPILNKLPESEASAMRKIREGINKLVDKELESFYKLSKEDKNVIN
jgi:hypothetical protein